MDSTRYAMSRNLMATLPHDLVERVLDGSPDAILICDPAGTVRYWNAAAERMFGFPATEALGTSMNLIIPERLRARHWAAWETTMSTGVTRYGGGQLLAVPALHKDGRQISIEFSIQLLKDAGDVIEWVVAVIRDVTERYRHDKAQRARLEVLEAKIADRHQERASTIVGADGRF
jgi:PAS domain S-box-containing protein